MSMKEHLITALEEQLEQWEGLIDQLDESKADQSLFDMGWSIKDVMNHLWGWQQLSGAWMEAAVTDGTIHFPEWTEIAGNEWADNADLGNTKMYELYHQRSWSDTKSHWHNGYLRLITLSRQIEEADLLDSDKYAWMKGYSLASVLLSSYAHHQEHYEKLKKLALQ